MGRRPVGAERLVTVSIAMPISRAEELSRWAETRGLSQSHAGRVVIEEGLRVVRGQDPERDGEILMAFQRGEIKQLPAILEEVYKRELGKLTVQGLGVAKKRARKLQEGLQAENPLAVAKAEAEAKAEAAEALKRAQAKTAQAEEPREYVRRPLTPEEQAAVEAEIASLERERQEGDEPMGDVS